MRVRVWGSRGSVPAPGPGTMRYGGNTSCIQVTLDDGTTVVLDAGTGIRELGLGLVDVQGPLHILLTHLHLDHIQGLMFFAPMFQPDQEIVIWGPAHPDATLRDRIARYISAPLMPVEIRELPCHVSFREAEATEWEIAGARVRADSVSHRGPTLGYRLTEGDTSLCYIPDHEPGLGASLDDLEDEWISGLELARGAGLLVHDAQYTDDEYASHLGWGHSSITDVLSFARRSDVGRLLAFHHDPLHDDDTLDGVAADLRDRWTATGRAGEGVALAAEGMEFELLSGRAASEAKSS